MKDPESYLKQTNEITLETCISINTFQGKYYDYPV